MISFVLCALNNCHICNRICVIIIVVTVICASSESPCLYICVFLPLLLQITIGHRSYVTGNPFLVGLRREQLHGVLRRVFRKDSGGLFEFSYCHLHHQQACKYDCTTLYCNKPGIQCRIGPPSFRSPTRVSLLCVRHISLLLPPTHPQCLCSLRVQTCS